LLIDESVRTQPSKVSPSLGTGNVACGAIRMRAGEKRDHELERLLFEVRRARLRLAELLQRTREQRAAFESTTRKFSNVAALVSKSPNGEGRGDR
jgi:hypothetical protein